MTNPEMALELFGRVPFLAHLDPRYLQALARAVDIRTVQPGEVLFHRGQHGDSMIVLASPPV